MPEQSLGQGNQQSTYIQIDQAMGNLERQVGVLQEFVRELSEGSSPPEQCKVKGADSAIHFAGVYLQLPDRIQNNTKDVEQAIDGLKTLLM